MSVAQYVSCSVSQMRLHVSDQIVDFLQGKRDVVFVRVSIVSQSLRDPLSNRPKRLQKKRQTDTAIKPHYFYILKFDWSEGVDP